MSATSVGSPNGQLWAEGRSTLQLHQQRLIPDVQGFLMTAVVSPPDSEIVAPFSVSGVRLGYCALVEPSRSLAEEYGVVVGHTLVDASSRSASVLMINPNAEEVVLPSFTCVGKLVPVSAVSVALADPALPDDGCVALPDHLEEIAMGSHPSLGEAGRRLLRDLLLVVLHRFSTRSAWWSRCLVYLNDVVSFGRSIPEALARLEEVLARLSDFGLQLKAKKCTFMQAEVIFLGHIVGRTGLACDPAK